MKGFKSYLIRKLHTFVLVLQLTILYIIKASLYVLN